METCPVCQLSLVETPALERSPRPHPGPLSWRTPSITDHLVVDILLANPQPLSGYSPATLLAWRHSHRYLWTNLDGTALIACDPTGAVRSPSLEAGIHYLQPVGPMSDRTKKTFLEHLSQASHTPRILGVSAAFLARHPDFCSHFDMEEDVAGANYIYSLQELSDLGGRKFQKKRNLLAQAGRSYEWTTEPLSEKNVAEVLNLARALRDENADNESLLHEGRALEESLVHRECYGLEGLLVRVDGRAVAFSVFEGQTPTGAVCHFEKGLRDYKGIYQVINNETAKLLLARGLAWINREEDMGDEGLRQAKLSYNPTHLEPSFSLRFRG